MITWHHGGLEWSCSGRMPLGELPAARMTRAITRGINKGKRSLLAPCPKCRSRGRVTWIEVGLEIENDTIRNS